MVLLLCSATVPLCSATVPLGGGLPHCFVPVGCHTAWGHWAGELLYYSATLPGGIGGWNSCNERHATCGEGGVEVVQCITTLPWIWAVELVQRTTTLPGRSGQWNSRSAQCLGVAGNANLTMYRHVGLDCRSSTAHCPQAAWRCIAGVPLPIAHKRCGCLLHEFHRPLPLGSVALHCGSSTVHCKQEVWWCIARVPLPSAYRQFAGAFHKFHHPLSQGSVTMHCRNIHI